MKEPTTVVAWSGDSKLLHRVASALLPVAGGTHRGVDVSLAARMEHDRVPGCSMALFDQGELVAAGAYGLINAEYGPSVDVDTLFQVASMSKSVTAFVVLLLVADGMVTLDDDVNDKLKSWRVPVNELTKARPVTSPVFRYFHDGNNSGFHCAATMYVQTGRGAVVMTNARQGTRLCREYLSGVTAACGRPAYRDPE